MGIFVFGNWIKSTEKCKKFTQKWAGKKATKREEKEPKGNDGEMGENQAESGKICTKVGSPEIGKGPHCGKYRKCRISPQKNERKSKRVEKEPKRVRKRSPKGSFV